MTEQILTDPVRVVVQREGRTFDGLTHYHIAVDNELDKLQAFTAMCAHVTTQVSAPTFFSFSFPAEFSMCSAPALGTLLYHVRHTLAVRCMNCVGIDGSVLQHGEQVALADRATM